MNFARLKTIYWTDSINNDKHDGSTRNADINKTFTNNLIQQASDYICAVERLELNLNGIPYYDGEFNDETIEIKGSGDEVDGVLYDEETTYQSINFTSKAYSLPHLIDLMNSTLADIPVGSPSSDGTYIFSLDASGFVTLSRTNHDKYRIHFPLHLNNILGLYNEVAEDDWTSEFPRWDIGDELQNIRISSNLNLVSDTVGQSKTNIVTDLSVGSSLSASSTGGYSFSSRDKLIYTPTNRRWLNFNSSAPIQTIRIYCEYVLPDGTARMVLLPHGAVFAIKLGFYKRV